MKTIVVKSKPIAPRSVEKTDKLIVLAWHREKTVEEFYKKHELLIDALKSFASEVVLEPISSHGERLYRSVLSILMYHADINSEVIVELDSEDVVLNTALIFAALTLPNPTTKIYAESIDNYIVVDVEKYRKMLALDSKEREIYIRLLHSAMDWKTLASTVNIPKSTLYRKLRRLIKNNLVIEKNNKYVAVDVIT